MQRAVVSVRKLAALSPAVRVKVSAACEHTYPAHSCPVSPIGHCVICYGQHMSTLYMFSYSHGKIPHIYPKHTGALKEWLTDRIPPAGQAPRSGESMGLQGQPGNAILYSSGVKSSGAWQRNSPALSSLLLTYSGTSTKPSSLVSIFLKRYSARSTADWTFFPLNNLWNPATSMCAGATCNRSRTMNLASKSKHQQRGAQK